MSRWIDEVSRALESGDITFLRKAGFYVISYWSDTADVSGKLKNLAIPREEFDLFTFSSMGTDCAFFDFRPAKNRRITISVDNPIPSELPDSPIQRAIADHFSRRNPAPLVNATEAQNIRLESVGDDKLDFFDIPKPEEHLNEGDL